MPGLKVLLHVMAVALLRAARGQGSYMSVLESQRIPEKRRLISLITVSIFAWDLWNIEKKLERDLSECRLSLACCFAWPGCLRSRKKSTRRIRLQLLCLHLQ